MSDKDQASPTVDAEENEIVSAARESRAQQEAADASAAETDPAAAKTGFGWKKAAGIGIGSAAVLAALIYANRDKR
jgi:hypothetical protein